jgi:hypothetical protein
LADSSAKKPAVEGTLRERPLPRLLQQLFRKRITGYIVVADQTRDESEVYLRDGAPVHVRRPVDTDRLDNLLVEYGVVPADLVAAASAQVGPGQRLGDVLERMGLLDRGRLAQVLKAQVVRKLTRLFFVAEGTYAVFVEAHSYGEGDDLPLMRVDPRSVLYPGIRAAYALPRVTQEVARLVGQRFRLREVSNGFITAMGMSAEDATIEALRVRWLTLDDLDAITSRPLEVRSIVLALYYGDLLERQPLEPMPESAADSAVPHAIQPSSSSDPALGFRLSGDSGADLASNASASSAAVSAAPSSALRTTGTRPIITVPLPSPPPSAVSRPPAAPPGPPVSAPVILSPAPPAPSASPAPSSVSARIPPTSTPASGVPVMASAAQTASFYSPSARSAVAPTAEPSRSIPAGRQPVAPAPRSEPAVARPARPTLTPEALRAAVHDMEGKLAQATLFELLGVSPNATADEVQTAFLKAARQFHPDRLIVSGLQDLQAVAERILARLNEAAMVLGDAKRRAEYVASLSAAPATSRGGGRATSLPSVLEAENLFLKGEVFLKKGDYAKAIECFAGATRANPNEPQYRAYLAWVRFEDPRARKETIVRETLKTVVEVMRERPKFTRGFYWVGLLWKFLNEPDKAAQAFRETVALDPSFIDASRELRLIEMRKNQPSGSRQSGKPASGGGLMGKFFKR